MTRVTGFNQLTRKELERLLKALARRRALTEHVHAIEEAPFGRLQAKRAATRRLFQRESLDQLSVQDLTALLQHLALIPALARQATGILEACSTAWDNIFEKNGELARWLAEIGCRYLGEWWMLRKSSASKKTQDAAEEIATWLRRQGLPIRFRDPLDHGWIPPYWSDAEVQRVWQAWSHTLLQDRVPRPKWARTGQPRPPFQQVLYGRTDGLVAVRFAHWLHLAQREDPQASGIPTKSKPGTVARARAIQRCIQSSSGAWGCMCIPEGFRAGLLTELPPDWQRDNATETGATSRFGATDPDLANLRKCFEDAGYIARKTSGLKEYVNGIKHNESLEKSAHDALKEAAKQGDTLSLDNRQWQGAPIQNALQSIRAQSGLGNLERAIGKPLAINHLVAIMRHNQGDQIVIKMGKMGLDAVGEVWEFMLKNNLWT